MLAISHLQYGFDWDAARDDLDKTAAIDPHNALAEQIRGHLIQAVGRMSEALVHFRRAVEADPLNLLHQKYLGRALHYAGRAQESADVLRRAIALNPQFPSLHYELGRALLQLGQVGPALEAFSTEPDDAWRSFGVPIGKFATHEPAARAALEGLLAHSAGSEFQVAEAYGFFGDVTRCFAWLQKARSMPDAGILYLRRDRLLASVENDPRFAALLKQMRMPPVGSAD